ncbi:hypothetical protein K440DRAFT_239385 [Wilcoxina mikolae CBS 423.85]|nr:hypothetical protein K440DRAFT_239385 [Wilcoxina mikolae CBS 423.85]
MLIDAGCPVNMPAGYSIEDKWDAPYSLLTPLECSLEIYNHISEIDQPPPPDAVVRPLLERGANVDGYMQRNPLVFAVRLGYVEIVRLLAAAGANVNIYIPPYESFGFLHNLARMVDYPKCIPMTRVLLEAGANPNLTTEAGATALHVVSPKHEYCLFQWASRDEVYSELIARSGETFDRADVEALDEAGWLVVNSLCEFVEMMLEFGADLDAEDPTANGKMPLRRYFRSKDLRILLAIWRESKDACIYEGTDVYPARSAGTKSSYSKPYNWGYTAPWIRL